MMKKITEKTKKAGSLPLLLLLALLAAFLLLGGNTVSPTGMTEEEMRLSETLSSMAGAGKCRVSIWYENASSFSSTKRPSGALIVSSGAHDLAVRVQITQAAQTLLGLESGSVAVYPMEETE